MIVAVDWGTSSFRAWLVGDDGRIEAERVEPLGILKIADGEFGAAFDRLVGDWVDRTGRPAIGAGMIGSRQGWCETPYAACPAGLDDLAIQLVEAVSPAGRRLSIIPGVAFDEGDGTIPDVMRGEETQIAGDGLPERPALYLLPGTHSKWALVEGRRIVWFKTFMTGELFAVLSEHSILGRLMEGRADDPAAFRRGLEAAGEGLLGRLFSARTLALFDRLSGAAVAAYLSGLLIGGEIREARAALAARFGGSVPGPIAIIGRHELAGSYRRALAGLGIEAREAQAATTVNGLLAVARAAGLYAGGPQSWKKAGE